MVLVNSNPATIMTDPDIADRVYVEPMTVEVLERVIEKEKPARLEYFGTLGPACADPGILSELFEAGMTGVRLNLSHTSLDRCGRCV